MKTIYVMIIVFLVVAAGCSREDSGSTRSDSAAKGADVAYVNGRIYTANESEPWAESLAIEDGKFVAVGSAADIETVIDAKTEVVELGGAFAMPGIVDLHVHPFATPMFNYINLDFSDPTDVDRMISELAAFAEANPDKQWLRAGSWGIGVFPNNSPRKELLDEIIPDRPVVLIDQTGHAYWLNSKGLELAGINADTPTDEYIVIDKDPETGEPTGTVRESAMRLVEQAAEWPSPEENYAAFKAVFAEFNSLGVTSMQTAEGNARWLDVVREIEKAGELSMRLFVGWDWHMHLTTPYTNDEMDEQIANRAGYASEMIEPDFVKVFLDGTPDGYTAPFIEPYSDGSGKYGKGKFDLQSLTDMIAEFDAQGVGVFMHSIGDASTRMALDAIEAVRERNGDSGVRHKIAHLTFVHPDDIPRFVSIPGVVAEMSPAVTYPLPALEGYSDLVGEERYRNVFAARSMLDAGVVLGFGTDWLTMIPPSPWMPMQGFVTRANPEYPDKGVLNADERVTIEQAIRMFTYNGAYAVGAEDRIGSIEPGKSADMIVLDRNLLEIDPATIKDTQVLRTVLNGRVVYDQATEPVDVIDESQFEDVRRLAH
ncbi:MAG: amidohydrolase [Gammaproteobacteria bacterium]